MNRSALLASTAVALLLCAAPATAQMQQKDDQPAQDAQQKSGTPDKGATQGKAAEQPSKGTAQSEPKDKPPKGNAQKSAEPKDKVTKGAAEKSAEPRDKATKGTAEKAPDKSTKGTAEKAPQPQDRSPKGTAEKAPQPKDKATKGTAEKSGEPKDKAAGTAPKDKSAAAGRVQVSAQQRTNIHQTLLKERNVNRVTNVNISINIGTRVPRSVRLAVLPASVIALVPEYRSYRYFVVDDRICIVEPSSYEIVEVITVSGQTATRDDRGGHARLVLTEEERRIILSEVDMRGGSTLALGALTEGGDVPRNIEVRVFPATVVEKVPKVKDYKFFTAENRLAIVDPQGSKVQLVIEANR